MITGINKKGQVSVEYVLITVLLVGIVMFVQKNLFKSHEFLANYLEKPWLIVSGVIENGVPGTPDQGRTSHPGHVARHLSVKEESE